MAVNSTQNIHSIVICANIFVKKDGKYLVIRRSPEKVDLPNVVHPIGGKIDANEDPLLAALRELQEEAGVSAKHVRLEAVITEVPDPQDPQYKETWLIFDFSGEYAGGELKQTDEGQLVCLTADEVRQSSLFPSRRELLDHIFDDTAGPVFSRFVYDKERTISARQITVTPR